MVKVKICGITTQRDALWAARCGADALGFNFVPGTPRYISPRRARDICRDLPPFLCSVGVFANEEREIIDGTADLCRLHCVQLHGDESPGFCAGIRNAQVIKAFRVSGIEDLEQLPRYDGCSYLLDARVEGKLGGTGRRIDPAIAAEARRYGPVILAGGLTPYNVEEAVQTARPYAVDVAGGVEDAPGRKSDRLVEEFIRRAKKNVFQVDQQ